MNFLSSLNESQLQAVIHPGGPLFVVAGAGTGKTKTLTSKIAYLLLNGVEPDRILAVTFTNKAAREMKERIIDMTGPYAIGVWLFTFHAFGLQILRKHIAELPYGYRPNFTVIDDEDQKRIIGDQIKAMGLEIKMYSTKALSNLFSLYKMKRIFDFERSDEEKIFKRYQSYLRENQLVDFDDLLLYPLEIFETLPELRKTYQSKFQHILVDEFQDTDHIQYRLLKLLGEKHKQVFVVGDPDQSIYSFRGANYENARLFENDFKAEKIILDKNYRSTNLILKAANQLIKHNINRPAAKNLESDMGLGEAPYYHRAANDFQEAFFVANEIQRLNQQGIAYEDMAVLYRNNVLSRMFEDTFIKAEIPYTIYGGISFYARREIKDALAFIRLALDFNQDFYLKRIINVPKRSIGLVSVQKLEACAKDLNLSMMEAIDHVEISGQTKKSMLEFKHMMEAIRLGFDAMEDLEEIMPFLMGKTGYIDSLRQEKDDIADDRIENLLDLKTVFARGDQYYEGTFIEKLTAQLDQISLYSDLDKEMLDENRVRLSTYHQVKGLEFKVVFMVVLEEGIFPSDRSIASSYELEEERRVAYVGMTRAKERLYLSYADQRMLYGSMRRNIPSRFVMESRLDDGRDHVIQNHTATIDHILKTGDKVLHQIFGEGVVIRVDDEIATIAFGFPHGIKKILESHPSIRKIRK